MEAPLRGHAVVDSDRPGGKILWVNERGRSFRILPGMRYAAGLSLVGTLRAGERLGASAVQDVVLAGRVPLVAAEDVPRLLADVVSSQEAPIGVRVGLLAELQRRGLVNGAPLWLALLRSTAKPQLLQVVRAAGQHPSPEVGAALVGMLAGGDDEVAAAAALALGDSSHAAAVGALTGALDRAEPRVRMAAIRALGRVGTSEARNALETVAGTHDDPATRRRAAAEVRTLER